MKEYKEEMTKPDAIIHLGHNSLLQHGRINDRIYVIKLEKEDTGTILNKIASLTTQYGYSKVFCKVPASVAPSFLAKGYISEGHIPGFYVGKEDAFFLSRFLTVDRWLSGYPEIELKTLRRLLQTPFKAMSRILGSEYTIRKLDVTDIPKIAALYADTFESYPFPIYDPVYIEKNMGGQVQYFGAFQKDELAALASAEIDFKAKNAEMTDFATHKAHTGHNLSCLLLKMMEYEMQLQGIMTLYTLARSASIPMNKTFIRLGFSYAGTLINNTNISGGMESMNLYYKHV